MPPLRLPFLRKGRLFRKPRPRVQPQPAECVFCAIAARRSPATIRYEDEEVLAIENRFHWAPVMLLVLPKKHLTQAEMWRDMGRVGRVAVSLGEELCPGGFRLLSNFGRDAFQTQEHGHIHILGGRPLGPYLWSWGFLWALLRFRLRHLRRRLFGGSGGRSRR